MMRVSLLLLGVPLLVGGCVSTATSIVKAPFQVAGKAVDWTTTSQEEADRNYGRKMRKAEAREGKERRAYDKRCRRDAESDYCRRGYQGYVAGRD
jgi:hypothetical protein